MSTAISKQSASFTRPANTTAYTAGDVVSNSTVASTLMKFNAAARFNGQGGYITKVRLFTDRKANVSQYRLYLFRTSEASVSVPVDNLPMTTIYADFLNRIGYIDLPAVKDDADTTNSTGAYAESSITPFAFKCAPDDDSVYGLLVDQTGQTPASGQAFMVELVFDRDTA